MFLKVMCKYSLYLRVGGRVKREGGFGFKVLCSESLA